MLHAFALPYYDQGKREHSIADPPPRAFFDYIKYPYLEPFGCTLATEDSCQTHRGLESGRQHLSLGSAGNLKKCQLPGVERCQIYPGNLCILTHHLVNVTVQLARSLVLRDLILFLCLDHFTVNLCNNVQLHRTIL